MKRVLMDKEGIAYGIHGEKNLKQLFQQNGWRETPPDAKLFLKLVNQAHFEGIGKLSEEGCQFVRKNSGMEFCFTKIEHPSGKKIEMKLSF